MAVQFLNYFLASVIVVLGIPGGYYIGKLAKDELKNGDKYFKIANQIILTFILLLFVYSLRTHKLIQLFLAILVLGLFIYTKLKEKKIPALGIEWRYTLLGIFFYLSREDLLIMTGSLILFYGLPIGTLLYFQKKNWKKIVIPMIIFVLVSNLLYLI